MVNRINSLDGLGNLDDDHTPLMMAYLDGSASSEDVGRLNQVLRAEPEQIPVFASLACDRVALRDHLLAVHEDRASIDVLYDLLESEQRSDAKLKVLPKPQDESNAPPPNVLGSAWSRLFKRLYPDKPIKVDLVIPWAAAWGGVAVFTVVLIWLVHTLGSDATSIDTPPIQYAATVTEMSDDVNWSNASNELQLRDRVAPGDYQLRSGKVELRFNDGSEVTVTAPARFSIEHGSAMGLQTGEISAFVPESGKGFEVAIPGSVVTDLGTAFDIKVYDNQTPSLVDVTEGMVLVTLAKGDAKGEAVLVKKGGFAHVERDGSALQSFTAKPERITVAKQATGVGITLGEIDPNWDIRMPNGQVLPARVSTNYAWMPGTEEADSSEWVSYAANTGNNPRRNQSYTFLTTIDLPREALLDSFRLNLRYIADEKVEAVLVNGVEVAGPIDRPANDLNRKQPVPYRIRTWQDVEIARALVPGTNTIEVRALNTKYAVGIRAELTATAMVPYSLKEAIEYE